MIKRLIGGVVAIVLLAAAFWLERTEPQPHEGQRPIATRGQFRQVVRTPEFTLRADHVHLATSVKRPTATLLGEPPTRTEGVFVLVFATLAAHERPTNLDYAELRTPDGLRYSPTPRVELPMGGGTSQPWLPIRVIYAFEVPRDRLTGLRFVAGAKYHSLTDALIPEVDIALNLNRGDPAAEGYELPEREAK